MKRVAIVLAGVVLACAGAAPARAQEDQVVAPPGNSGVEEYLEIVPGSRGDRPAGGGGQAESMSGDVAGAQATPRAVLGEETTRALRRLGPDGRRAAEVAAASAPQVASDNGGDKQAASDGGFSAAADDGGGRAEAVAGALAGDGGGIGMAFPLLLLGALVAALGLLAVRRTARNE
jgi:hypothetical protein